MQAAEYALSIDLGLKPRSDVGLALFTCSVIHGPILPCQFVPNQSGPRGPPLLFANQVSSSVFEMTKIIRVVT